MLNQFKILTLSHHQANPEDVKHMVLPSESYAEVLTDLKAQHEISEILYLATCNRVIYFLVSPLDISELSFILQEAIVKRAHRTQRTVRQIWKRIQAYQGMDAIKYYVRVAASMDSLVIGEREIFRQLREAYDSCHREGLSGDSLRLVQQSTVKAAKKIYSESRIGEKPVSIVSLAMRKFYSKQLPTDSKILLVGAGMTIDTVSKFLQKAGYGNVDIYNRTLAKAQVIANHLGAGSSPHQLEDLRNVRAFDCIISCTASTDTVITHELYAGIIQDQIQKQVLIIDLAVPEDVELSIFDTFPTERVSINDLRIMAEANHEFRKKELQKANEILDQEMNSISELFHRRFIERAFGSVPQQISSIKRRAMEQVFKNELDQLDDETMDLVERMMTYMEKKCVAIPMKTAKEQYSLIKKSLSSESHHKS